MQRVTTTSSSLTIPQGTVFQQQKHVGKDTCGRDSSSVTRGRNSVLSSSDVEWLEGVEAHFLLKQTTNPGERGKENQGSRKTPRNTFWNTVEDSGTVGRAEKDKLKEPKPLVPPQPYSWLHTQGPKDERRELHAVRYRETNTHLSYV